MHYTNNDKLTKKIFKAMEIRKNIDSVTEFDFWSGAVDTINTIEAAGKIDELDAHIEEVFEGSCTDTQLNDYLWFESSAIYEALGLDENGEEVPTEEEMNEVIVDNLSLDNYEEYTGRFDMDDFEGEVLVYEGDEKNETQDVSDEFREFVRDNVEYMYDSDREELYNIVKD